MTAGVGGSTKKFAFGAAYQLGYAVGNIIGPQTYRANEAPNYYVSSKPHGFQQEPVNSFFYTDCQIYHACILDFHHHPIIYYRYHTQVLEYCEG